LLSFLSCRVVGYQYYRTPYSRSQANASSLLPYGYVVRSVCYPSSVARACPGPNDAVDCFPTRLLKICLPTLIFRNENKHTNNGLVRWPGKVNISRCRVPLPAPSPEVTWCLCNPAADSRGEQLTVPNCIAWRSHGAPGWIDGIFRATGRCSNRCCR
jgi:hypothetical protein